MFALSEGKLGHIYQVETIHVEEGTKKHLLDLGLVPGTKIAIVNYSGENGIVLLHSTRIALNRTIISQITVKEPEENRGNWMSMDQLKVGDVATVVNVHGSGAIKRRLMDMGLTRKTPVTVVKLAPMGDPIEIKVRGYQLSLRKSEAELVLMEKEEV